MAVHVCSYQLLTLDLVRQVVLLASLTLRDFYSPMTRFLYPVVEGSSPNGVTAIILYWASAEVASVSYMSSTS